MDNYIEIILLGVLVILVYKKPIFLENINDNKILLALIILLNMYLLKNVGISAGIIMSFIIMVLIDTKENFCDTKKEGFTPKIQIWRPSIFTGPCLVDLDREMKVKGELATIESTEQLDNHTNNGYKIHQKQLY
uniref:Uncharacterized protein n=1 Tax=viral metagenome TaxID=1070528 RepID=A0A6C0JAN1_9ZZZZ|tara:strand:- start:489 stop:890 length:402 start_codon:yes stop_codon:yes gene_type:complete